MLTAQTILAETGCDVNAWKTEQHFASWTLLSPNRDISGGKVIRQRPKAGSNRVGNALRIAAQTLLRSQSYLGARFRSLRTRLGAPKAIKAMARYLACLVYRMLKYGQDWVDKGAKSYERKNQERILASLQRKAAEIGYQLTAVAPN